MGGDDGLKVGMLGIQPRGMRRYRCLHGESDFEDDLAEFATGTKAFVGFVHGIEAIASQHRHAQGPFRERGQQYLFHRCGYPSLLFSGACSKR